MTADEIRSLILDSDLEHFFDNFLMSDDSPNFPQEKIAYVAAKLSTKFSVAVDPSEIKVMGSAKLGYGLFKKTTKDGKILPAFRPFSPSSDIDLAIVCPKLFETIWDELSIHANSFSYMPWNSEKLGDYMMYGWLRPDHFPKRVRLRKCDDWWDTFSALSADSRLGRRPIRGALYYSYDNLKRYQLRGLNQCRLALEAEL